MDSTTTNNPAPVEQCDIDLANVLIEGFCKTSGCYYALAKDGGHWIVQEVARHRLRATGEASRIRSDVGVEERLREILPQVMHEHSLKGLDYIGYKKELIEAIIAALRPAATEERSAGPSHADLVERVRKWYETATPEEKAAMWKAQRESWVRAMAPCEHGVADFEECAACRGKAPAQQPAPSVERSAVKVLRCCYGHTEQFAGCEDCPYVFGAYAATPAQQPAPSVDVAEREAIEAAIRATEYKYFGDYEMSDDQREAVDQLVLTARRYLSTPAPTTTAEQGDICPDCKGSGWQDPAWAIAVCGRCNGSGGVPALSQAAAERPRAESGGVDRVDGWRSDCHKCVASKFTCDEHFASADHQAKALTPPADHDEWTEDRETIHCAEKAWREFKRGFLEGRGAWPSQSIDAMQKLNRLLPGSCGPEAALRAQEGAKG